MLTLSLATWGFKRYQSLEFFCCNEAAKPTAQQCISNHHCKRAIWKHTVEKSEATVERATIIARGRLDTFPFCFKEIVIGGELAATPGVNSCTISFIKQILRCHNARFMALLLGGPHETRPQWIKNWNGQTPLSKAFVALNFKTKLKNLKTSFPRLLGCFLDQEAIHRRDGGQLDAARHGNSFVHSVHVAPPSPPYTQKLQSFSNAPHFTQHWAVFPEKIISN